jgi:hypothetical protein
MCLETLLSRKLGAVELCSSLDQPVLPQSLQRATQLGCNAVG